MPTLARFVPPAKVLDKHVYSPWTEGRLDALLNGSGIDTLIITGGETDVCVLATVLGAIDRGFRTVLVTDAICSSADATHDALMELYCSRFSEQVEAVAMNMVLESWRWRRRDRYEDLTIALMAMFLLSVLRMVRSGHAVHN